MTDSEIFSAKIRITQEPVHGICTVVIENFDCGIRGEGRNVALGKATLLAMREATKHLFSTPTGHNG